MNKKRKKVEPEQNNIAALFQNQIWDLVERLVESSGLTYAEAISALEIVKTQLVSECIARDVLERGNGDGNSTDR